MSNFLSLFSDRRGTDNKGKALETAKLSSNSEHAVVVVFLYHLFFCRPRHLCQTATFSLGLCKTQIHINKASRADLLSGREIANALSRDL